MPAKKTYRGTELQQGGIFPFIRCLLSDSLRSGLLCNVFLYYLEQQQQQWCARPGRRCRLKASCSLLVYVISHLPSSGSCLFTALLFPRWPHLDRSYDDGEYTHDRECERETTFSIREGHVFLISRCHLKNWTLIAAAKILGCCEFELLITTSSVSNACESTAD